MNRFMIVLPGSSIIPGLREGPLQLPSVWPRVPDRARGQPESPSGRVGQDAALNGDPLTPDHHAVDLKDTLTSIRLGYRAGQFGRYRY